MALVRRFNALFLVALLSIPAGFALAQDTATPEAPVVEDSFAMGLGVPATSFDERGNPVSSVTVTDVEVNWEPEEDGFPPTTGMVYVLITMEHTNLMNRPMQVDPWSFTVVDNYGLRADFGYSYGSDVVTDETVSIDGGETGSVVILVEMWSDTTPMMVMYQPDFNSYVFIHLGE